MKCIFWLFLILITSITIQAQQFHYEPSIEFPYGKAHTEGPEAIKDWDPLIGKCQCRSVQRNPDGTWQDTIDMTWIWQYILDGKAVQDFSLKADGRHASSVRQYIPDSSKWYVTFFSTFLPSSSPSTWEGGKVNKDIILYKSKTAPNGLKGFYKITFSDISYEGFNWLGEWVNPDETIRYPTWKIFCKKKE